MTFVKRKELSANIHSEFFDGKLALDAEAVYLRNERLTYQQFDSLSDLFLNILSDFISRTMAQLQ